MPFSIEEHFDELKDLRHHIHSIAEVSDNEEQTAQYITDFLKKTEPDELQTGIGGHGILATYKGEGEGDGPHVLVRCELDALPIPDEIDKEYKSGTEDVGHKCGHDGHMAMLCGLALYLAEESPETGKVSLLFQPAEETGEGAARVLDDQQFGELNFDYCFALHNLPGFKKHLIIVRQEVFAAASVGLIVRFRGATAHAAHPEQGRSPAMAMAQTVQAFSAVPQFYSSLEEETKVTVIQSHLGERAFGTSPGQATVMATLRTYDDEVLQTLKEKCIRIANGHAETYDLEVDLEWVEPFPATENHDEAVELICDVADKLDLEVHHKKTPFSWSEDFGRFTKEITGAMFGLGIGEDHAALHAESYDFEDEVIPTGVSMFMQIVKELTDSDTK